jgi:hypothetical protein
VHSGGYSYKEIFSCFDSYGFTLGVKISYILGGQILSGEGKQKSPQQPGISILGASIISNLHSLVAT